MHITLPDDVKYIINTITQAGYEAFAVGGCVRDRLLNKEPDDYDITTAASPEEVKSLFRRTIDTGIAHGTVTIMIKDTGYEVTTYRIDGKYEDGRHPSSVGFTKSLKEDLLRRDFTINAMAYNEEVGLVDLFGGQQDLKDGIIRCVGVPYERFTEDALRIMRAVRFSAQLGYMIEENTLIAMKELAERLNLISEERIQVELLKLVTSDHPENIKIAYEQGLTKVFFPEFDLMMDTPQNHPHHSFNVGDHSVKAMEYVEKNKYLRLAMLFHDIGKPKVHVRDEKGLDHFHGHPEESKKICIEVLRRLRFDNDTINVVSKLVGLHDLLIEPDVKKVRKAINKVGEDIFPLLLKVKKADVLSQSEFKREEKLDRIATLWEIYDKIIEEGNCLSLKDLEVKGADLIEIGFPKGPSLGDELSKLLELVLDDPALNTKKELLMIARKDLNE